MPYQCPWVCLKMEVEVKVEGEVLEIQAQGGPEGIPQTKGLDGEQGF